MSESSLTIRVLLADDHAVVLEGLSAHFARVSGLCVLGSARDCPELGRQLAEHTPEVVVTDLRMPGNVLELIVGAMARPGAPAFLIYSGFQDANDVALALRAGALGYIVKSSPLELLVDAIRRVRRGEMVVDPCLGSAVLADLVQQVRRRAKPLPLVLSQREQQVLARLARGYTNREIAVELGVSVKTAETLRARLRGKLGLRTRAEIVRYAEYFGVGARGWGLMA